MRGRPTMGSHIVCPQSNAKTIWSLRSVSYSLANRRAWRAELFQSMRRRSMPGSYSASASNSASLAPDAAGDHAELGIAQEHLQRGAARRGDIGPHADFGSEIAADLTAGEAKWAFPAQPHRSDRTGAAPGGDGFHRRAPCAAGMRGQRRRSRPPGARRGSRASAATGAARGASARKSASTVSASGSPTSPSCRHDHAQVCQRGGEQGIEQDHDQQRRPQRRRGDPCAQGSGGEHQRQRRSEREQHSGTYRGIEHREGPAQAHGLSLAPRCAG